jgi:uncharacterized protein (TIGR02466 family)
MAKSVSKKKSKKLIKSEVLNTQLQVELQFPSAVYLIERPDFLEIVNTVSEENLEIKRKEQDLDEMYPLHMTSSYYNDPRLLEFTEFVGATSWNILNDQGYDMQDKSISYMEMWTQEHYKHSAMDQHVHGYGSQIVGFYFLEAPENCSKVVFHDPRIAKVQIDLPETDITKATFASKMINFQPKPGLMIFTNSWLAHSFTRHASDLPIKFVHFNLTVVSEPNIICNIPSAEVI